MDAAFAVRWANAVWEVTECDVGEEGQQIAQEISQIVASAVPSGPELLPLDVEFLQKSPQLSLRKGWGAWVRGHWVDWWLAWGDNLV